jgi:type I restriction enzyme S subunit
MVKIINNSDWMKIPIKEVYLGLYDGPHATPKPAYDGPVFLGIKNITEDGKLDLSEIRHIAEEDFPKWTKRVLPRPGDIVFTYEATLNRYAIIPKGFRGCLGRRLALIRPDPQKIDTRFLFYYFFGEEWRKTISEKTIFGSTVDRIPIISFPEFEISLPPLSTQRRIAAILSAYDDLIENNTRRIKILEEMAQALYREWFVHFRFPGHEKVRMVDSPLGRIPEGWEVTTIREVSCYISRGISPKYNDLSEHIVINQKCIRDNKLNLEQSRRHLSKAPRDKIIQFGDVLINSTGVGTLGRVAQVYQDLKNCTVDSHISIVRPGNKVTMDYFGLHLLTQQAHFEGLGAGSTGQAELSRDSIANTDFLLPSKGSQLLFTDMVKPLRKNIILMINKNINLRNTRNLLLPSLISDKVKV